MWEGLAGMAQPGMLACGRLGLGPWQCWLKPVTNSCHLLKLQTSLGTTLVHRGCSPSALALTISSVLLQLSLATAPQRIQHPLTWAWLEAQCLPLETAKIPEKCKECLTRHLRAVRNGEHTVIHPHNQTQTPAQGLAYGEGLDWNGAAVEGTALGVQNLANGNWNGATDYRGLS